MPDNAIEMIGVNKWFGDFHVLKDIDLTVRTGEKVVTRMLRHGKEQKTEWAVYSKTFPAGPVILGGTGRYKAYTVVLPGDQVDTALSTTDPRGHNNE